MNTGPMKHVIAVLVAVLACGVVSAQDWYAGADPAPSMYAAAAGMTPQWPQQQQTMPPAYGSIMYGGAQPSAAFVAGMPPQAFVEQQQMQQQQAYAPYPQESEEDEEGALASAADEAEAANEAEEAAEHEDEAEGEEEVEQDTEAEEEEGEDGMRFAEVGKEHHKKHHKKHHGKKHHGKKHHGGKKGHVRMVGKKGKAPNSWFKPTVGKKKNKLKRQPNAKTPKSAGGKPLPPMPAPLPQKPKIDCKKNPSRCIEAETPAKGEEPGDHSPKAVYKKKMEVIRKSLLINNRNIAAESKWIDQVDAIMKQYNLKVKKVKAHISDERKAIKELLRQRRIVINEKKQKELELKLKIATTELNALTEALSQVQKKEQELGAGKTTLGSKIKLLADDLKKLRTKHAADKAQSIVEH